MPEKATSSPAKKHLKEILLLFSVPIGIIVIVIVLLYVPRLFAHPAYDFIYCEGYSCGQKYTIDASNRIHSSADTDHYPYQEVTLRYYDVQRDASRPLQIDEAVKYRLDATSKSPDGYTLQQSKNSGGFLFWDSYHNSWSLRKGLAAKPVSLDGTGSDKKFIGWVLP